MEAESEQLIGKVDDRRKVLIDYTGRSETWRDPDTLVTGTGKNLLTQNQHLYHQGRSEGRVNKGRMRER